MAFAMVNGRSRKCYLSYERARAAPAAPAHEWANLDIPKVNDTKVHVAHFTSRSQSNAVRRRSAERDFPLVSSANGDGRRRSESLAPPPRRHLHRSLARRRRDRDRRLLAFFAIRPGVQRSSCCSQFNLMPSRFRPRALTAAAAATPQERLAKSGGFKMEPPPPPPLSLP